MPCDTVSTAKVKLNAATVDKTLLSAAMKELGISSYSVNESTGTLTVSGERTSNEFTASVNRAYSKQVVMSQAKRFGWSVNEQPDGRLVVQKASF